MMVFEEPKRLVPGSLIDGFTHDPNLSWVVAYAGPCNDSECKETHKRLYLIPVLGWLQVLVDDHLLVRPAVMGSNGSVVDYMDFPDTFRFVAVLQRNGDVVEVAREIYKERYGKDEEIISEETTEALPN